MKNALSRITFSLFTVFTCYNSYADDLLSSYQQALANDPVTLKAQAQFMATKEAINQTRALLLPQINATAGISKSKTEVYNSLSQSVLSYSPETTSIAANLSMELYHHDTWLNLDNRKKAAHQSDIAYQAAKQNLIVRVTNAYFNVLSAKDDLTFAIAERTAIERQLEQTKQRFSVGLTAITDVHEAQAEFDNAETAKIQAENNVYSAEEVLRELTNIYPKNMSILNTERFSASKPLPSSADAWQQTAEAKNLSLILNKVSVDIAKENIKVARAGHLPFLDLNANINNSKDHSLNNPPNLNNRSIGIQLTVPIYSGGATSSVVKQAQHNYVAANQDLVLVHRQVVRTTRNAYNTVIANVSSIKSLNQSVISAESALKATEAGFEVGTRTIVDVLNSTRNLYNAKRNLSSTRYNYIKAILLLKQSGGTISEKDIFAINAGLMPESKQ